MQKLSTGAEFHDFEKKHIYVGTYISEVLREKDTENGEQKAGTVMGYEFEDENGNSTIIGSSYMIAKDLAKVSVGAIIGFKFLGKTKNAKGQSVNRFENIHFDSFVEALSYYGDGSVNEKDVQL